MIAACWLNGAMMIGPTSSWRARRRYVLDETDDAAWRRESPFVTSAIMRFMPRRYLAPRVTDD